jgi:cysteinyl-tRNA synthetase
VVEALADDLNGHMALVHMHDYFKRDMLPELRAALEFIGFGTAEEKTWWRDERAVLKFSAAPGVNYLASPIMQSWASHYEHLCADRNFADADPIRNVFETYGFKVSRDRQGDVAMHATVEFDVNDLEAALESLK